MADREEMAMSFGGQASAYETGRPDYPVAAVAWMLEFARRGGHRLRVVDVGAGTGKLTRVVAALGAETIAVEPDTEMLTVLHTAVPGIPTFVGTAERMPIPEASVDAVVLGQAWHWVDVPDASREAARVLRPGGVLGLIWNIRDESVPWVARLTDIMHGSTAEVMLAEGEPAIDAPFAPAEAGQWRWSRPITREGLFAMAHSRSYVITAAPDERARIDTGLSDLFDEIGAVGDAEIELPYVTRAYRALRP